MGITLKNNKSVTKNMTIKGDNGVGIKTIASGTPVITEEKTTTPITVILTDETTQNFNVEAKNGSSGGTGGKKYFHYIVISNNTRKISICFNLVSANARFTTIESLLNEIPKEGGIWCVSLEEEETQLDKLPMYAAYAESDMYIKFVDLSTRNISVEALPVSTFSIYSDEVVGI